MRTYNQTPTEVENQIVKLYTTGISSIGVSKQTGVHFATVLNIVRRHGLPTRTTQQTSKRYTFNEQFFEKIDTEEKAYWLGFILADGCISRGKDIIIALKESDKSHLDKFIKSIEGNNKYQIVISNGFGGPFLTARLAIRCQKMCEDLSTHSITERKSLTAVPPSIPEHLQRHFWRGVVDGDGHVCVNSQYPYKSLEIGLCGSKSVIQGFIDYVKSSLSLDLTLSEDHTIWRTKTSGKKAMQLCSLLYGGSVIYLERKLKTYEQYKQDHTHHTRHSP